MSGIAGIYNLEAAEVDRWKLALLSNALAERGPDGGSERISGPLAMVYRAFHTNAESRQERQPLVSGHGPVLCWDGRLDNREELRDLLREETHGDRTDAGIVMAAYHKYGVDFLPRLIGDFAISLWDPTLKTLLLARDPFGVRPLYYFRSKEEVVWASTLTSLLALPDVGGEVNDEYVAGCLSLYPELSSSPYRNILAVEPGQVVTWEGRQFNARRFWTPHLGCEGRSANDREYEEQFRQLFRDAVACRLRSDRPVWSELSGGLDSSAIVLMADRLQTESPIKTVSFLDNASVTFFDRRFVDVVENVRGTKGLHLDGNGRWISFAAPEENFIPAPLTSLCIAELHQRLWRSMKEDRARVLLSGLGGDQVTWSTPEPEPELADLLFKLRPLMLHRRLRSWSEVLMKPYAELLWQDVTLPLLPAAVKARLQTQLPLAPWLDRDFVKRMRLAERMLPPKDPFGYRLPSRRIQSSRIAYIVMNIARGDYWEHATYDKTYPFLHRPLVEFLLRAPIEQKLRPFETRSLMRRALRELLPKKILERRSKGATGEALCRGLANEWSRIKPLFADARVCRRGYVDRKRFIDALDRARHGIEFNISTVVQTLALEVWLRSVEHHVASRSAAGGNLKSSAFPMAVRQITRKGGQSNVFQ